MDLELAGRGAFVVGATGDVGRAVVARLLSEGARVVVGSRSRGSMERCFGAAEKRVDGMVEIDLRDDASTTAAVKKAEELLGGVDILVCTAAGDIVYGPVWGVERNAWVSELALKLIGTSQLCTKVAQHMLQRGRGVIVNVIGIATDMVVTMNPVGSAGNSGLRSFTRVLAAEVARSGVRVVGVSPGMVAGARLGRFAADKLEQIRESIPQGRIGKPEEFADVIAFVASDRASYMTGEIVIVDGGLTLVR